MYLLATDLSAWLLLACLTIEAKVLFFRINWAGGCPGLPAHTMGCSGHCPATPALLKQPL